MTTIAANKFQIAGDRQATHSGGMKFRIKTKLYSFNTPLIYHKPFHIGMCGNIEDFSKIIDYFTDPLSHKKAPRLDKGEALVLSEDGKIWTFWTANNWTYIDQPFYAIGSGTHFAMGAMASGASPYEAIKHTMTLCPATGMGVTKIDISP